MFTHFARFGAAAACTLALTALPLSAFADVPPPNTYGCTSKSAGATCKTDADASGTCVTNTCTKLDYAHWDKDATSSPPTRSYDCLKCDLSAAPTPTAGTTTTDSGSSSCAAGPVGGAFGAVALLGAVAMVLRRRQTSR